MQVLEKKQRKQTYNDLCDIVYGKSDKERGEATTNWNQFIEDIYKKGGVELPPKEPLKITKVQNEYIGQTKTKKEFLKIQDLDFDEINIGDEVLGLYDNKNKGLHYFDIGGQAKLTAKIKESNTNNNTKIGKIFKIKITTKIPNRGSKKDKKPYYFHGEIV